MGSTHETEQEADAVFSSISKPQGKEQLSCLHALNRATDTKVIAKVVGQAPIHSGLEGCLISWATFGDG